MAGQKLSEGNCTDCKEHKGGFVCACEGVSDCVGGVIFPPISPFCFNFLALDFMGVFVFLLLWHFFLNPYSTAAHN